MHAEFDLSSVSRTGSDYKVASLAKVINEPSINELIVRSWLQRAYGARRSTLVFTVNIDHVYALAHEFQARGIDARGIHSGVAVAERQELLQAFQRGEFPVLINCGTCVAHAAILTEGADVPPIDCVLLARPTQSQNLFAQMIGRGMRLSPDTGKQDCLILDLVGNLSNDMVCTPTLFGLYDEQPIEGAWKTLMQTNRSTRSARAPMHGAHAQRRKLRRAARSTRHGTRRRLRSSTTTILPSCMRP